jgi:putative transcriptional regulator
MINCEDSYLSGQLLIAMPSMPDPRFSKTVIYMCAHNAEGAMGLVINRSINSLSFPDLLEQLGIKTTIADQHTRILFGGPVESGRGFVLHSPDYQQETTLVVDTTVALTATVDILKAMAGGIGPDHSLLALGYAGWGPGQLDGELKANGWLQVDADEELVFGSALETKWERALAKIGIDPSMLSSATGHA